MPVIQRSENSRVQLQCSPATNRRSRSLRIQGEQAASGAVSWRGLRGEGRALIVINFSTRSSARCRATPRHRQGHGKPKYRIGNDSTRIWYIRVMPNANVIFGDERERAEPSLTQQRIRQGHERAHLVGRQVGRRGPCIDDLGQSKGVISLLLHEVMHDLRAGDDAAGDGPDRSPLRPGLAGWDGGVVLVSSRSARAFTAGLRLAPWNSNTRRWRRSAAYGRSPTLGR